ncbi:hypothetical protein V6N11_082790 [Hibiscus sabdariffa]|uniref:Uncharacterized protein n=1 Tax=Hibiscus sabdariffa TaxID=183260 RepID=A0ABR2QKK4_9ROSI
MFSPPASAGISVGAHFAALADSGSLVWNCISTALICFNLLLLPYASFFMCSLTCLVLCLCILQSISQGKELVRLDEEYCCHGRCCLGRPLRTLQHRQVVQVRVVMAEGRMVCSS